MQDIDKTGSSGALPLLEIYAGTLKIKIFLAHGATSRRHIKAFYLFFINLQPQAKK